jgi:hypothetical protein
MFIERALKIAKEHPDLFAGEPANAFGVEASRPQPGPRGAYTKTRNSN